jgi:hypothetical protein
MKINNFLKKKKKLASNPLPKSIYIYCHYSPEYYSFYCSCVKFCTLFVLYVLNVGWLFYIRSLPHLVSEFRVVGIRALISRGEEGGSTVNINENSAMQ